MFDNYTKMLSAMTPEDLNSRTGWELPLCDGIIKVLEINGICLVDESTIDYVNNKNLMYIIDREDDLK